MTELQRDSVLINNHVISFLEKIDSSDEITNIVKLRNRPYLF